MTKGPHTEHNLPAEKEEIWPCAEHNHDSHKIFSLVHAERPEPDHDHDHRAGQQEQDAGWHGALTEAQEVVIVTSRRQT